MYNNQVRKSTCIGNKSQLTVGENVGGDVEGSKESDGMNDGMNEGTPEILGTKLGASDGKHASGSKLEQPL